MLIDPNYYLHFRNSQSTNAKNVLNSELSVFKTKFLDSIVEDIPSGVWSIQAGHSGSTAQIKNFIWPGFAAYHLMKTNEFASVYIGPGIKNKDAPFMLQ
jgi:hypothetical protein